MATVPLSKFQAKRVDSLNRFYTRDHVGELIASQLGMDAIASVVDLGSGGGSLCGAIVRRWPEVRVTTVDIDPACGEALHLNLVEVGAKHHRHHVADVFDPQLPAVLGDGGFDLAVCNPPFFRPTWRRAFADILQEADLADAWTSTAEVVFLAQNLRLVREGGMVALIVPDGFITGWPSVALRRALLSKHRIEAVIQLPEHAFRDTDARCFVIFIRKGARQVDDVQLFNYEPSRGLSAPLPVPATIAEQRMDYEFHAARKGEGGDLVTLRRLGADVIRGTLSTVAKKEADFPVFHTTDYGDVSDGLLALQPHPVVAGRRQLIIAEAGDILMARVDRRLHEKVALVVGGCAALTDCVYRVRLPKQFQAPVFYALRSAEGAAALLALSKGVSARLLGKGDLLDMPLRMKMDQEFPK